jgi:hypothetical protein
MSNISLDGCGAWVSAAAPHSFIPEFTSRDCGKPRKSLVTIVSVSPEIRTKYLPKRVYNVSTTRIRMWYILVLQLLSSIIRSNSCEIIR